jgi:hypothetical protein
MNFDGASEIEPSEHHFFRCSDRNTDGTTPNLISVLQKDISIIHEQQSVIKFIGWSCRCEYVVGAFVYGMTLS